MTGAARRARRALAGIVAVACGLGAVADVNAAARHRRARTLARKTSGPAAATGRSAAVAGVGSVLFVTDKRAYLDRGAHDGLGAHQAVPIFRGSRSVGTCTIETLAERQATCVGGRLRAGDTFKPGARTMPKRPSPPPTTLPTPADKTTLRARAAEVAEAPYDKVDFKGGRSGAAHAHAVVTPSVTIWRTEPDPGGAYSVQQIDGSIQVFDIAATGLDFAAAFTAMRWGARGDPGRFRPSTQTQFYLWNAEVSRRNTDAKTVFAVGRIWPWHAPGLAMLDGVQVGRRNDDASAEVGAYAGLMPWASTTAPSASGWAAGAYGTLAQTGSAGAAFRLAREEARVGVWSGPGTGLVTQGDVLAQAWVGAWSIVGGARALLATAVTARPVVDRAHVDVGTRATAKVGVGLHLRYIGAALPAEAGLVAEAPATRGALSALGDVHDDLSPRFGVAGYGGFNQDRQTGRFVAFGAAEARLPRLLGDAGGAAVGGEVQEGWMRSWIAYAQVAARLGERLHLLGRVTATSSRFATPTSTSNVDELGGYLHLDGTILSWMRLRLWSLIRAPLLIQDALPLTPSYGVVAGLGLTGSF